MNKERRDQLTTQVAEILKRKGLLNEQNQIVVHEIVNELDKIIYESLNRKVSYEVYLIIWKKYNLEGGYTVSQLARAYGLSITTITLIVKDKYF
jgi:cell envelope opacity-associated protein A